MSAARPHCEACLYWQRGKQITRDHISGEVLDEKPAPWGDCHRYAPRGAVVINEAASGCISGEVVAFPTVDENDWCGEYVDSALALARGESF